MFVQLKKAFQGQIAGARIEVADLDGKTLIESGVAEAIAGDPLAPMITKHIEGMLTSLTDGLNKTIEGAMKSFAAAQTLSRKNAIPLIFGQGNNGDPTKTFGDWLTQVAHATTGKSQKASAEAAKRLEEDYGSMFTPWQKAAMAMNSGTTGGYIVPPDFYNQLLAIAAEENTFRQFGFVQPMASATLQFPFLDITTVQAAGTSPFFGGVIANWTAEAQTRTETEPTFKMMELKAQELSGYSVSSNILLQDAAFGLERFLLTLFGKAIAWYEEYAFLQGNGVGKPLGCLNAPAKVAVTRNTASHVYFTDIATMLSKLLPSSYTKAHWYASPTVVPELLQLKDGASRAIFISIDQGAVKAPIWKLLNLPIHITEKLPALGSAGDIMLIDPSLYVIGDRMQLEVAASEHVNFLKNQMTWRFVQRVDGRPWLDNYITLQDGTSTVSPFVALTT